MFVSVLTFFELEYSLSNCSDTTKQKHIKSTIDSLNEKFNQIGINKNEAKIFGKIKSIIKNKTGKNAENMRQLNIDIMVLSSAISNSCVVVSGDKIFKTISEIYPQADFENWLID